MHCKLIVSGMAAVRNDGVGEDTSKGKDYTFSVYTFTEEQKETVAEEVRNVDAVTNTEDMILEEKANDVLKVRVNRAFTLRNMIPEGNDLIGSGANFNIYVIQSPLGKSSDHSDQIKITRIVLGRRHIKAEEKGYEEESE